MTEFPFSTAEMNKKSEISFYFRSAENAQDPRFGQIELLVSQKDPDDYIMMKEKRDQAREEFLKDIFQARERTRLSHGCLMMMLDYESRWEPPKRSTVRAYYEYLPTSLQEEIQHRKSTSIPFSYDEMCIIAIDLLSAIAYLQENKMVHGDIRPAYAAITSECTKLVDRLGDPSPPNQVQWRNFRRGVELYVSPLLFKAFCREQKKVRHNPYKSDVFSLGLLLLEAGLLDSIQAIYDRGNADISSATLAALRRSFNARYSPQTALGRAVDKMLALSEAERLDPKKLFALMQELKECEDAGDRAEFPPRWEAEAVRDDELLEESFGALNPQTRDTHEENYTERTPHPDEITASGKQHISLPEETAIGSKPKTLFPISSEALKDSSRQRESSAAAHKLPEEQCHKVRFPDSPDPPHFHLQMSPQSSIARPVLQESAVVRQVARGATPPSAEERKQAEERTLIEESLRQKLLEEEESQRCAEEKARQDASRLHHEAGQAAVESALQIAAKEAQAHVEKEKAERFRQEKLRAAEENARLAQEKEAEERKRQQAENIAQEKALCEYRRQVEEKVRQEALRRANERAAKEAEELPRQQAKRIEEERVAGEALVIVRDNSQPESSRVPEQRVTQEENQVTNMHGEGEQVPLKVFAEKQVVSLPISGDILVQVNQRLAEGSHGTPSFGPFPSHRSTFLPQPDSARVVRPEDVNYGDEPIEVAQAGQREAQHNGGSLPLDAFALFHSDRLNTVEEENTMDQSPRPMMRTYSDNLRNVILGSQASVKEPHGLLPEANTSFPTTLAYVSPIKVDEQSGRPSRVQEERVYFDESGTTSDPNLRTQKIDYSPNITPRDPLPGTNLQSAFSGPTPKRAGEEATPVHGLLPKIEYLTQSQTNSIVPSFTLTRPAVSTEADGTAKQRQKFEPSTEKRTAPDTDRFQLIESSSTSTPHSIPGIDGRQAMRPVQHNSPTRLQTSQQPDRIHVVHQGYQRLPSHPAPQPAFLYQHLPPGQPLGPFLTPHKPASPTVQYSNGQMLSDPRAKATPSYQAAGEGTPQSLAGLLNSELKPSSPPRIFMHPHQGSGQRLIVQGRQEVVPGSHYVNSQQNVFYSQPIRPPMSSSPTPGPRQVVYVQGQPPNTVQLTHSPLQNRMSSPSEAQRVYVSQPFQPAEQAPRHHSQTTPHQDYRGPPRFSQPATAGHGAKEQSSHNKVVTVKSGNLISSNPIPVLVQESATRELYLPQSTPPGLRVSYRRLDPAMNGQKSPGEVPTFNYQETNDPLGRSKTYVISRGVSNPPACAGPANPLPTDSMPQPAMTVESNELVKRYDQAELRIEGQNYKVFRVPEAASRGPTPGAAGTKESVTDLSRNSQ